MSERRSRALGWGLALSAVLCLAMAGLWLYGYQLYRDQAQRLAAIEADTGTEAPAAGTAPAGGTVVERLRADEQQIDILRGELSAARATAERAEREQEALRLKLANAEHMRADVEARLDASHSRITALEAELGAGGSVERLVDATGQPLAELESVTPRDLATLGMELRLVERERDGARLQLDRALERIIALETAPGGAAAAPAAGPGDAEDQPAELAALAARLIELEAANRALQAAKSALEANLAGIDAERLTFSEAAAARAELQERLAASEGERAETLAFARELETALETARSRITELETGLASAVTARDALDTEKTALAEAFIAERDAAASAADAAATRIRLLETEQAALAETLASERDAAMVAATRIDELEAEQARLAEALLSTREAADALSAERAELAALLDERRAADADTATAAFVALENRNAELRAALAALEARIAGLDGETATLRQANATLEQDRLTLEKATQDALAAQAEAHAAALAGLAGERDRLQAELAAAESRIAALAQTPVGPARNGEDSSAATATALSAANERIAALEDELAATVRLAAELRAEGGGTATPAAMPADGRAASAEQATLERELAEAKARIDALQALLFADWAVKPLPAPRRPAPQ